MPYITSMIKGDLHFVMTNVICFMGHPVYLLLRWSKGVYSGGKGASAPPRHVRGRSSSLELRAFC